MYRVLLYERTIGMTVKLQKKYWIFWFSLETNIGSWKEGIYQIAQAWKEKYNCQIIRMEIE